MAGDANTNRLIRRRPKGKRRRPEHFRYSPRTEDLEYPAWALRPRVREDCLEGGCNASRPCPWVSCKWHLATTVTAAGTLRLTFRHKEVWEFRETCALDVADRAVARVGSTRNTRSLREIGELLNITRERVRQIIEDAKRKMARAMKESEP